MTCYAYIIINYLVILYVEMSNDEIINPETAKDGMSTYRSDTSSQDVKINSTDEKNIS